jgi:hypothetical protein
VFFGRVHQIAGLGAAFALSVSCNGDPGDTIVTSHEDLCAGSAPEYAAGYVVAEECPFVQQLTNISNYGAALPSGSVLSDGHGVVTATVSHSCDAWMLGTDADGVDVIIHRDQGKIFAHGNLHPGQPLSKVHSPLALPLTVK